MNVDQVGFLAFLVTVMYTAVGLPAQIVQNYRRRSVAGLSLFMAVTLFFTMILWVIYGYLKADWYIVGSNVPGAICIAIVLMQFRIYGRPPAN